MTLTPWATVSARPTLIEFVQQYRTTTSIGMLARPDAEADVVALVPADSVLTSIARTADGRWLQFKTNNRARTGFLPTARLSRVSTDKNTDPLTSVIGTAGASAALDLNDLARSGRIEQRHQRNAMERREAQLRAEQERLEQERYRIEQERERQLEKERAQRRREAEMAEYDSSQSSSASNWNLIKGTIEAMGKQQRETMVRNHQIAQEARLARDRQIQAGLEAQRRQVEQARQRQQATQQQQRQQVQRQADEQRKREAAARQREAQQRQQEESARRLTQSLASASSSGGTGNNPGRATGIGSSGPGTVTASTAPRSPMSPSRQKTYEPMPETAKGNNDTWFGDRDKAIFYARLGAVNDISSACANKQARSDRPTSEQIRSGSAPPRWTFSVPDCHQGGWGGKEWKCSTPVAGTCYRIR
ncbi:MAG: hypothetical protein R6X06_07140 [Gammaproteobacteria bacterium]